MWRTTFELRAIPPFSFSTTVTQFGVHPPLEYFEDAVYYRGFRSSSGNLVTMAVRSIERTDAPKIEATIHASQPLEDDEEREILEVLDWQLGLSEDLSEFYALAEEDPTLRFVRDNLYGMRLHASDLFYSLSLAIALQNAPVTRSRNMLRRLTERFGEVAPSVGDLKISVFPRRNVVARVDVEDIVGCKWGYRADYLKNAAKAVNEEKISIETLSDLPTPEAKALLVGIKGLGEYSAEVTLLETLRRYDVFPIDIWSKRIFSSIYFQGDEVSPRDLRRFAEDRWGKHRGLAFVYILNDLNNLSTRLKIEF